MMIEVMVSQRGYRMVYYGVINFISSILFFYPSYNFNNNTLDKINGIIFFIIIFVYLVDTICNYPLIVYTIKHWSSTNYGMGKMSIFKQIFFWGFRFNYIIIISYIIILLACYILIKLY